MATTQYVEVYSARDGTNFEVSVEEVRKIATRELGMVPGPFELNIFTKTILATALQREQIERNEALRLTMETGGDWKGAVQAVQAVSDLMEKLGVDDAKWDPLAGGKVATEVPREPTRPVRIDKPENVQRMTLELDGQETTGF